MKALLFIFLFPTICLGQMSPTAQQFIVFTNVTQGYTMPGKAVTASARMVMELKYACTAGGTTYKAEWTNIVAAYPFIGNTANSNRTNLVNLANTDGAFRMTFTGSPTMDLVEGVEWNGTTQFGDTKINPTSLSATTLGIGVYSRTSMASATKVAAGYTQDVGAQAYIVMKDVSGNFRFPLNDASVATVANSNATTGFYYGCRSASTTVKAYRNSTNLSSATHNTATVNGSLYVGAANYLQASGPSFFASYHCVFAIITIGITTDADEASIYNAVQDYQTQMGRQMGAPVWLLLALFSMLFSRKPQEKNWYVRVPGWWAEYMDGKVRGDNIFSYGVTMDGDTVTAANAQKDFPDEFTSLTEGSHHLDSLYLSPEEFMQDEMK